jgi:hypothetical protein
VLKLFQIVFTGAAMLSINFTKEAIPVWIGDYVFAFTEQVPLWRFLVETKEIML